ncbi:hypothetical protein CHS0354_032187 [Potamilus streckersoni]|uniref:RCK N-terminal domain-containing protein n=1 Tax=Potamilus streckersoni TaxID=2493646 RepID=A0AAE0TGS1_9BIVA|nr:hypothetical protein CHS0354_032187 [Potamilus streckersoni]
MSDSRREGSELKDARISLKSDVGVKPEEVAIIQKNNAGNKAGENEMNQKNNDANKLEEKEILHKIVNGYIEPDEKEVGMAQKSNVWAKAMESVVLQKTEGEEHRKMTIVKDGTNFISVQKLDENQPCFSHLETSTLKEDILKRRRSSLLLRQDSDESIPPGFVPLKIREHHSLRGRLHKFFYRRAKARFTSAVFDLVVKTLACILYVVRIYFDDLSQYECNGSPCTGNNTVFGDEGNEETNINWYVLLWVQRPLPLWILQVTLGLVAFFKALLYIYIAKGTRCEVLFHGSFLLEFITTVPLVITLVYPSLLKDLFVPHFLNCWLAKIALEKILNDLHHTRDKFQTISVTLSQQMLLLTVVLLCLTFTTVCGVHHIQRASYRKPMSMFDAFYFVIVTFTTVGYGDIAPDIWISRLFMILMICVAFAFIPFQIQIIASTWIQRGRAGKEYTQRKAAGNKHVVVCSQNLSTESVMDFLQEFFAHPKLEGYMVVLLGSDEMDNNMQMILKDPKWTQRVIYLRGSALKDRDLRRCRITEAEACFILAPRNWTDKSQADHHTVLRSWAVKDFAPECRQYIQLFKPENIIHVKFAEHVVCEDEFKYALLANNCLYPGLSTIVSLLVRTTAGLDGKVAKEKWQQTYGHHAGNDIYHIQLGRSVFFKEYEGKKFTEASFDAHQKYGVCLMAVMDSTLDDSRLQLNPGPHHILKSTDFCFYMSTAKDEYSKIDPKALTQGDGKSVVRVRNIEKMTMELQRIMEESDDKEEDEGEEESAFNTITSQRGFAIAAHLRQQNVTPNRSFGKLLSTVTGTQQANHTREPIETSIDKLLNKYKDMGQDEFITGPPPVTLYVGSKRTTCYLMRECRPECCLEWAKDCEHCQYKNTNNARWHQNLIILAAEHANNGIYNFIVPLRSEFLGMRSLSPIILLLEEEPHYIFLEAISHFPHVYWMIGKITSVDDLLKAGINKASHLVIVNRETSSTNNEDYLVDAETIVAVQTISKLFPKTNIITELTQESNMRYIQFCANDVYQQMTSGLERKNRSNIFSNLPHILRLPFAAGQVFSACMLDTLLYQTFVKGYLITFVRLLLGIDEEENSGHLSSIKIKKTTKANYCTYGELYNGLCTTTGEVPIALYRTEQQMANSYEEESKENNNTSQPSFKHDLRKNSTSLYMSKHWNTNYNQEQADISDLVRNRMKRLALCEEDYCEIESSKNEVSYVILNPSPQRTLKVGDLVYVIQPSSMFAIPSRRNPARAKVQHPWTQPISRKYPQYDDTDAIVINFGARYKLEKNSSA